MVSGGEARRGYCAWVTIDTLLVCVASPDAMLW